MAEDCERGYVYILTNKGMPGLVKIGRSIYGGKKRAGEMYQTGAPHPFELVFEALVEEPAIFENDIHAQLEDHRVNSRREFFLVSLDKAMIVFIDQLAASYDRALMSLPDFDAACGAKLLSDKCTIPHTEICRSIEWIDKQAIEDANQRRIAHRTEFGFKYKKDLREQE